MKYLILFFMSFPVATNCIAERVVYVGSTPAHRLVRAFLKIPLSDSIDFVRWNLDIGSDDFKLQCRYGLANPGTPGFKDEQSVAINGQVSKHENYYELQAEGRQVRLLKLNMNILHFVDGNKSLLSGNGGYSYALNNMNPLETGEIQIDSPETLLSYPLVYEGRTPCQDLSAYLGLNKSAACDKMKWYFLLYVDSLTGKPSHYRMAGIGYSKESMASGKWEITRHANGQVIYRVYNKKWTRPLELLRGDGNVLFFLDADGRLRVGNDNFSYTLNREIHR